MKSVSKNKTKFAWAAAQAGRQVRIEDTRCATAGHRQRTAATSVPGKGPVCWECYLGADRFKEQFKELAEGFYQPGGPGYAGED